MKDFTSDNVSLVLPAKREYVSTARLTASSVANRIGYNIDEIEDIKVSVSEICNMILSKTGDKISQYKISFEITSDKLEITFTGDEMELGCFDNAVENEFGLYIIKALMDSVDLCNNNHSIVMTKKIGE
jgi:serine/threonine-protein kinase RsbW